MKSLDKQLLLMFFVGLFSIIVNRAIADWAFLSRESLLSILGITGGYFIGASVMLYLYRARNKGKVIG